MADVPAPGPVVDLTTVPKLNHIHIIPLTAPGPKSNYLDWVKAVCALISQIVEPVNLRFIRQHGSNAHSTWEALHKAHQNSTAGGRMYWLQKVVNAKMDGDDIDSLINELATSVEKLNALVEPGKPLTTDNIHAASLLKALPSDWVSCVSSLMNEPDVSAGKVVLALKAESLRRKNHLADVRMKA
ncbi:hypothetical protein PTTG_00884, partial [Puccinia triticina 1-1 BBBD Race 1]